MACFRRDWDAISVKVVRGCSVLERIIESSRRFEMIRLYLNLSQKGGWGGRWRYFLMKAENSL